MQQPSFLTFISFFLILQIVIAWAVNYFLIRWFSWHRLPFVRFTYWIITAFSYLAIFFRRPLTEADYSPFNELILFFLNLSYVWSIGLLAMLFGFISFYLLRLPGRLKSFLKKRKQKTKIASFPAASGLNMSRRSFLKNAAFALPLLSFGLSAKGVANAGSKITVTRRQLTLPGLSSQFDQIKIAQITDTHIGSFFGMDKLRLVSDIVREEKPHLLVITGDFIDDPKLLAPTFDILNPLAEKMPYGAYFCWGNHEYFRNFNLIKKYFDQSAITVLKNENSLVCKADSPLYVAGVDYPFTRKGENKEALRQKYLTKALEGLPPSATTILISHHSDFIEEAFDAGIPLTLSGHTHGGQITLFGKSLLPLSYKYMLGMYSRQNCHAYVSAGAGHWLPFRLNCPPEIAVFTLKYE